MHSNTRLIKIRTVATLGLLALTAACDTTISPGIANDADMVAVVESCQSCHAGPLSLADNTAGELAAKIQALAAGKAGHPVPLPDLSAAQRRQLAAELTAR